MSSIGSWHWVSNGSLNTLTDETVSLTINGKKYRVPEDTPVTTKLNEFIRDYARLKGTKFMCLEGGCGACVVVAKRKDAATEEFTEYAVNSCLVPILSCNGWAITTIEGVGNKTTGYGPVQKQLAKFNGSQCGYCSPGMVMNMEGYLRSKKGKITPEEVENAFSGNICRCTGYRSILAAMKTFVRDESNGLNHETTIDIEDLDQTCLKSGKLCIAEDAKRRNFLPNGDLEERTAPSSFQQLIVKHGNNNIHWYTATEVGEIFQIFDTISDGETYKLVAGNTAFGAIAEPVYDYYIDINNIKTLKEVKLTEDSVTIGPEMTLANTATLFFKLAQDNTCFKYLKDFAEHINLIANEPVRNIATLAGNLALKNQHNYFPSDIFLLFCTAGGSFTTEDVYGSKRTYPMEDMISVDLYKKVIIELTLPHLDENRVVKTYKIMPVTRNTIAIVNAGFNLPIKRKEDCLVEAKPRIVYGGINPQFIHAGRTENYLIDKHLLKNEVVQKALQILDQELDPNVMLPQLSPEYRKRLAESLFYKFVLFVGGNDISEKYRSGGSELSRPLSFGKQTFQTNESLWPNNEPVEKLEAIRQCSGEAEYINDIPVPENTLFGAFVIALRGPAKLVSIDASAAMEYPGVVSFLDVKSIPGKNSFINLNVNAVFDSVEEPIFADGVVLHSGQVVGLILADKQTAAWEAAKLVKVNLTDFKKPILSVKSVVESGDRTRIYKKHSIQAETTKNDVKHKVTGNFEIGAQYHNSMETQVCLVVPIEDGYNVYSATHFLAQVQGGISLCLNVPANRINLSNRRVGGSYGAKLFKSALIACACAIGAYNLKRPVRMITDLETTMRAIGKRNSSYAEYEVGVNDMGEIQYANINMYSDFGSIIAEDIVAQVFLHIRSCYNAETWNVTGYAIRTDKPPNTAARGPGSTEAIGTVEHIMDHIAHIIKRDPIDVRMVNLAPGTGTLIEIISQLRKDSDYDNRQKQIAAFNEANRWKKKGLAISMMNFTIFRAESYHALVSIYSQDGTVAITHGGIELGQGINTKVAQICAATLGIDLSMVQVKPTLNLTSPNDGLTGGSFTSESVSYAVLKCCETLLDRLKPFKKDNQTWVELMKTAAENRTDLLATYMVKSQTNPTTEYYSVFGAAATETILDTLTGQSIVSRVDVIEDAGLSINPAIDVGQVEGAFMMGLGLYFQEELVYDPDTGLLLTDRTWNYKVPGALDIPVDFRVTLLQNSTNTNGLLRCKAIGEPPLTLSCGVLASLRNAIKSAAKDAGKEDVWLEMNAPSTVERRFMNAFSGLDTYST